MRRTLGLRQHHAAVPGLRRAAGKASSATRTFDLGANTHARPVQVRSRWGDYVNIPVIPGAVLVNVGDLMQRWTNDQFVSSVSQRLCSSSLRPRDFIDKLITGSLNRQPHRVLLPPAGDTSTRQSLAFFLHPDDEAVISCCDGSDSYPPIKSSTYLKQRFADSYGRN